MGASTQPPMGGKELLLKKNSSLAGQVVAQRREINDLRKRLDTLRETETRWQDTTACVSSLWDELNQSIGFLQFMVGDNSDDKDGSIAAPALEEGSVRDLLNKANPFLAHMLQAYLPDDPVAKKAAVSLTEDLTATETALRARMMDTLRAATTVLRAIDEMSGGGTRPLPGDEEKRLSSLVLMLKAENGRLLKESLQDHAAIKDLEASVADKDAELLVLSRRLAMAENEDEDDGDGEGEGEGEGEGNRADNKKDNESNKRRKTVAAAPGTGTPAEASQGGASRVELDLVVQELERRDKQIASLESELYVGRRENDSRTEKAKAEARERQDQIDAVTRDLDQVNQKLRDAYREQDRLNGKLRDASRDIDRGSRAVRRESRLESALSKLEADVKRLRTERNAAEDRLHKLEHGTGTKTAPELLLQMKGMEAEMKILKDGMAAHRRAAEVAEAAMRTTPDVAEHAAKMAHMQGLVDAASSKLNHWIEQFADQVKANEELRWMIRSVAGQDASQDAGKRDVLAFMRKELPALEKRLQEVYANRTSNVEKAAADKLAKAEEELKGARGRQAALEADLERATAEVASLKEESEMFWKEMDSVSEAYEASREQNARLLEAMTKRDEDNAHLMSEAVAATRERAIAEEERQNAEIKMGDAEKEMIEWRKRAEDVERMHAEASKDRDALRMETAQNKEREQSLLRDIKAMERNIAALQEDVHAANRHVQTIEADKKKHLTDLKLEKTRADRANAILSGRKDLKHLATDDKEMAALRKMVNCSVCSTRLKDRMITRCNHLFCSECIQENLASRHRKCPGCGGKFSENDVQPFFFT